jgi:hypothetical protein
MATLILFIFVFKRKFEGTNIGDIVATLLQFIQEFYRKFQGTDTVDIDNIDEQ